MSILTKQIINDNWNLGLMQAVSSKDWSFIENLIGGPVTEIEDNAFTNHNYFGIQFPASVETIGASAFENRQLTFVVFDADTGLKEIKSKAFKGTPITDVLPIKFAPNVKPAIAIDAWDDNMPFKDYQGNSTTFSEFMKGQPVIVVPDTTDIEAKKQQALVEIEAKKISAISEIDVKLNDAVSKLQSIIANGGH